MSTVRIERRGAVHTIVLARPAVRNAVDRATAAALLDAFTAFEADATASVAVLWGEGGTFCAGADLRAIADGAGNVVSPDGPGPLGPTRLHVSKPVIAAISGHAVAGGLELACWCDLRVAEADAVLGVFCRRFGVPLVDGGAVRLPRIIGLGRALDLILSGRPVGAAEALAIGLVNRVVPHGEARAAAEALAAELAQLPQGCLRADRASVFDALAVDEAEGLRREYAHGAAVLGEVAAGAAQFFATKGCVDG